ncbi:DUF4244 domain-containing protein [Sinomonas sp. JGH33]|uniref:DUF4244 domain-containing protein n=1 Tax=Sinomonas terricola TaxID=3110330 RepID=A0ABU5T2A4_9MICC|nr:DUF4244 domain-containing protein [Sinomonas sp. JGH33]MEA5453797.1 DUF4244 domain-containing protein [Sinomonas sp. JGH33]
MAAEGSLFTDVVELYPGACSAPAVRQPGELVRPSPGDDDLEDGFEGSHVRMPRPRGARGARRVLQGQLGMATAEYAIATLAAVAFAGLLVVIMRSDEVRGFLMNIVRSALAIP